MVKMKRKQVLIAALFGAALLTGWCFWQNKAVRTTVYVIESSKLKPDAPDITIIQISDLHNAEFGDKQEKLIRKIKEAKPDIIAVTGYREGDGINIAGRNNRSCLFCHRQPRSVGSGKLYQVET